jgi:uncharacterized membrane protein
MEYVLVIVIIGIVAMGVWVAKHNQQFIDSKNANARLDRAFKIAKEREDTWVK